MKDIKLTKEEKSIEKALLNNEFVGVGKIEFEKIVKAAASCKKDTKKNDNR